MEKLTKIIAQLYEILGTPVSIKILEKLNEKQIWKISAMIENIIKPNENAFYFQNAEDSKTEILSLLDFGKNKIKPREYIDKTKDYLSNKKLI
jgi:hypothetical protein